ncbi:MAG: signal peptide peptidase SppA [Cyclobacteriaceae bacterium]
MNFFKAFLASCLGTLVTIILLFVLLIGILSGLASEKEVIVKNNSVLHLKLDAQITEQQIDNPFEGLGVSVSNIGLLPLKQAIAHAQADPKIKGIYLDVTYPMAGFSTVEEIRQSLIDFRKDGKWVVAYADAMSEQAYYLASAADKIYLNPEGELEFNGLAIEMTFFKKMFDKLEIKPEIFRVGEFKSAVEPFMLDKMSPENRLQLTEMVNSIYDQVLTRISESRNIPKQKLEEISDNMQARNAALALNLGLVDSLLYFDQVQDELKQRLSLEGSEKVNFIKYNKYRKSIDASGASNENEVAVIVADGTIYPGGAEDGIVGADTFIQEIRKARENKKVKAIVLRINSPGGSFQASDAMWREITLTAKTKPIIASMSDYAASGGYYLAMGCDTIVAQPHTITGSIGIFSVLFDASGLLNNKLGITTEEVKTGQYGEMTTLSRPLTDAEKNVWQRRTDEIYETFTGKAAEGRGITKEEIKKVASGRVWTGIQAKDKGLVDVLGGFDDAVKIAADKAGVADNYKVKFYPRVKNFYEQLLDGLEENARTKAVREEMGQYYPLYEQWQHVKSYYGVQARMPFEFQIH